MIECAYHICSLIGIKLPPEILQRINAICIVTSKQHTLGIKGVSVSPKSFLGTGKKWISSIWGRSI